MAFDEVLGHELAREGFCRALKRGRIAQGYLLAGPDAGTVEARIDDGAFRSVSLYHRFSKGLHYPRTVLFATDLSSGNHLLTVRISAETKSTGNAVRIMKFVAN